MAGKTQVTCWEETVDMGAIRGLRSITVVTVTHNGPKLCLMPEVSGGGGGRGADGGRLQMR